MIKKHLNLLAFAGLFALGLQFSSCLDKYIAGSLDESKEPEKGFSSQTVQSANGFNIALIVMGAKSPRLKTKQNQLSDNQYITEDPAENPFDRPFAAANNEGAFRIGGEIEFVQKGSKEDGFTTRENYLEGVADAFYYYTFTNGNGLYGGLGPYIAYGVGGQTSDGSIKTPSFGPDAYKRFDAGLNLKAGYQMTNGLMFELGYDLGLFDKSQDPSDYTSHNRNFSISIGYSIDKIITALK
jgi:hypothetical protein